MSQQTEVLVVEDEVGMRITLVGLLEDVGYRAISCESGEEALEYVESCLNGAIEKLPDIVLLDVSMPGLTGFDVL